MDHCPVEFNNMCDYSSLEAINTIMKEDKFIHVRNKIRKETPFGELLKIDQKQSITRCVARNAVKAWNDVKDKLVIGVKEYEIDSKLVKKCLNLSITGNRIIRPKTDNHVPVFIKQAIPPQMLTQRKKFNLHVVDIFRSKKDDVKDGDEVMKLSKLYTAFLFSALLFPRYQRVPTEYFYLLDDRNFCNLKLHKFDTEVAKFLRDGIITAKNAKTKSATVNGCLHIVDCLYSQEKLPMRHIQNKRERKGSEVKLDESPMKLHRTLWPKRLKYDIGNCSEEYPLKKEPESENRKPEIIDLEDGSSEEGDNDEDDGEKDDISLTDDEVRFDEVHKPFIAMKRDTMNKVRPLLEYMGAGQPFEGQTSCDGVALEDGKFEAVGGFHVRKAQAKLYEKIWLKYGHIASSKVLTDSYAQVPVVSGLMATITDMHSCRFSGLSSEKIEEWEENIKKAEKVEFNVGWVRDWFEDFKKKFYKKRKLDAEFIVHVDLLQAENTKCIAAKNALKEAEENVAALQANMIPLLKEIREYAEEDNRLLSKGWLQ
ncbi:hypothetical protein MKW94_001767 [Papaver nudicaule]|uniref:Uncharacterized protein n=1 Tax=Papaver nudicaule TaxID=74823 RepID=A0AA41SEI7_PAPNU|nr:hypothetical protein [Papaver nudicaule]